MLAGGEGRVALAHLETMVALLIRYPQQEFQQCGAQIAENFTFATPQQPSMLYVVGVEAVVATTW